MLRDPEFSRLLSLKCLRERGIERQKLARRSKNARQANFVPVP
jgi:hypothetical protein